MSKKLNTVQGTFFDTINTITAACAPTVLKEALGQCEYYNGLLSKTVPGSDVWRINHAQGAPVEVSLHTARILGLALEMYRASGGCFNIAIGPVMTLWHFTDGSKIIPDASELRAAVGKSACSDILLSDRTVTVPPWVQIDLGGIAKGYIADRIAEYLRQRDVTSANINLGGNVVTIGNKPDGMPWQLGLQIPSMDRSMRKRCWAVVACVNQSVVISGSYERGFEKDGKWYHHILDPHTGMPMETDVLSVTVCAPSSFLADALTTPMFILGEHEGAQLARRYGVDFAYYLTGNRVVCTPGMRLTLINNESSETN